MTPNDARDSVLRCADVGHTYHVDDEVVPALNGVTLTAERGEVTALVGPSGSGKSTLLRVLGCLDRPESGTVHIDGIEITGLRSRGRRALRRDRIGYVHANPAENLLGYLTVGEHLTVGARLRGAEESDALVELLGLTHRIGHHPSELSGGEQQRVALAFAAAGDPAVLLADEPTAQLDRGSTGLVVDVLRKLADRGHAVLVATHDPDLRRTADRIFPLVDGTLGPEAES